MLTRAAAEGKGLFCFTVPEGYSLSQQGTQQQTGGMVEGVGGKVVTVHLRSESKK